VLERNIRALEIEAGRTPRQREERLAQLITRFTAAWSRLRPRLLVGAWGW
jgi:hypothetical protein